MSAASSSISSRETMSRTTITDRHGMPMAINKVHFQHHTNLCRFAVPLTTLVDRIEEALVVLTTICTSTNCSPLDQRCIIFFVAISERTVEVNMPLDLSK
jgi:hypothetical protein